MKEVIVTYVECKKYGENGYHVKENRGQRVIKDRQKWCGCQGQRKEKAVWPREAKVQQSSAWSKRLKSIAKEEVKERDIRRMFKILREVWLDIGIEKVDMHEGITVKVLLDSGTTGMFMDKEMTRKHGFKMMKLKRPLKVKNIDGKENSGGNIMHQVEVNIFYKNHMERMRMDVCNLKKTEVILGMP